MDPYGPPRKRPRPESGPLNGSNGANGGHGGVDDCKLSVYSFSFVGAVRWFSGFLWCEAFRLAHCPWAMRRSLGCFYLNL